MLIERMKTALRVLTVASVIGTAAMANAIATTSVKAQGMAGATLAYPIDSVTPSLNPANVCLLDNRFDVGGGANTHWKSLTLSDRPAVPADLQSGTFNTRNQWNAVGEAGVVSWFDPCIAAGIQWNNYNIINTRYKTQLTDFSGLGIGGAPLGTSAEFDYRVEELSFAVAYRLNEYHNIGIGLNLYFSWLKINGLQRLAIQSVDPANFTDRGRDNATGVGVTLGWTGLIAPNLFAAAAFSPKVSMERFKDYSGFLADGKLSIPETWRFGLAYEACCTTVFTGEFEFRRYSKIPSWSNDFPGNSGAAFPTIFGTNNGPGFGWDDQWIAKFGGQWSMNDCVTLRAGYRYEQSLIRGGSATSTTLNVLTDEAMEHFLSVGFTWNLDPGIEISYFSEYGFRGTKNGRFPLIGTSPTVAPDFAPASTTFKDSAYETGLSIGFIY